MADFNNIKQEINSVIYDNENGGITSKSLRELEINIVDSINELKLDVISDLSEIRQNSSNAYQKPSTGIPETDLDSLVLQKLNTEGSSIFNSEVEATNAQRNQALANVSNQEAEYDISEESPVFTGKMGYVVLQPETNDKTTFAALIANKPNTIFEIRDVFDLGDTQETPVSVTLPAGSTLKFNGGLIKNGTITGSATTIDAPNIKIFENVDFRGTFCGELNAIWVGAKPNDNTFDNSTILQKWFGSGSTANSSSWCVYWKKILFPRGVYYFFSPVDSLADNLGSNRSCTISCDYSTFYVSIPYDETNNNGQSFLTIRLEEFTIENVRIYNRPYGSNSSGYSKTVCIYFVSANRFNANNIQIWYFDVAYMLYSCWYGAFSGKQTIRGNRVGVYIHGAEINTIDFHNLNIGSPASRNSVNNQFRNINESYNVQLTDNVTIDNVTYNVSSSSISVTTDNEIIIPKGFVLLNSDKTTVLVDASEEQTKYSTSGTYYIGNQNNVSEDVVIQYQESDASLQERVPICGFDIHSKTGACKFYGCCIESNEYGIRFNYMGSSNSFLTDPGEDRTIIDSCYFEGNKKYCIYIGRGYYKRNRFNISDTTYNNVYRIVRCLKITNCRFFEGTGTILSQIGLSHVTWTSNQPSIIHFESDSGYGTSTFISDYFGVNIENPTTLNFRVNLGDGDYFHINNNVKTSVFATNNALLNKARSNLSVGYPLLDLNARSKSTSSSVYSDYPIEGSVGITSLVRMQDYIQPLNIKRIIEGSTPDSLYAEVNTDTGYSRKKIHNDDIVLDIVSACNMSSNSEKDNKISLSEFFEEKWNNGNNYTGYVSGLWRFKIYANPTIGFVYKYNESKHPSSYTYSDVVGFSKTALDNTDNTTGSGWFSTDSSSSAMFTAIFLDALTYFRKTKNNNTGSYSRYVLNLADVCMCGINNSELIGLTENDRIDSNNYWIPGYRRRLFGSTSQMGNVAKYLNNVFYDTTEQKLYIYNGYDWVTMTKPYQRYKYVSQGKSISERMTVGINKGSTFFNEATGITYTFIVNINSVNCGTWLTSIGNITSLDHPNGYNATNNPVEYSTELSAGEMVMYNGNIIKWDGTGFVNLDGSALS